jgi:hypothetical protein
VDRKFRRCRASTTSATATAQPTSKPGARATQDVTTSANAAHTDASATHLVSSTTATQASSTNGAHSGCDPSTAPAAVATPLPPWPRRYGDVTCPSTAASPAISPARCDTSRPNASAGTNPFATSSSATVMPTRRPSRRPALVAPGLPEPDERRSAPARRAYSVAGETAPSR